MRRNSPGTVGFGYQLVFALALLACATEAAHAATWFVSPQGTDTLDCGTEKGSLACRTIQYTIDNRASNGDMVVAAPAIYSENLSIGKSLTLAGTRAKKAVIDGGRRDTALRIRPGVAVVLSNLIIRHGFTRKTGGGIRNHGLLTLVDSAVANNAAISNGETDGRGGGIFNASTLTVLRSTLSGNRATEGGGILNLGVVNIADSSLSGNYSESFGGAIESFGDLALVNSTFADNIAIYGGAIYSVATIAISSSTFSGNSAISGGGIYNGQPHAEVTLKNTIAAGNSASYKSPDCAGNLISQDYNLIGDTSDCSIILAAHDITGVSAQLGPLADNGGPTQTLALLPGSPAIDSGNPGGCTDNDGMPLSADQRGLPRPSPGDGRCDIGSYELQQ